MKIGGMKESHDQIIDVPNVKYEVYHSKNLPLNTFLKRKFRANRIYLL